VFFLGGKKWFVVCRTLKQCTLTVGLIHLALANGVWASRLCSRHSEEHFSGKCSLVLRPWIRWAMP